MFLFYDHNYQLIFFGLMSVICLVIALTRSSRKFMWFFVAFFILTIRFEYQKHLYVKIQNDMIKSIFPEGTRFKKYNLLTNLLGIYVPVLMDIAGWGIIIFNFLSRDKKNK